MPIYEYRCSQCGKYQSKFWRTLSAVDDAALTCSACGSRRMARLVSKVRVLRSGVGQTDAAGGAEMGADGDIDSAMMREMEGLDENDPRALGRFMRKMAAETGESLGPEFDEVVGRLEKGEDPEKIERDMGEMFGGPEAGAEGDGSGMGEAPAAPQAAADDKPASRRRAKATKPNAGKSTQTTPKGKRKRVV